MKPSRAAALALSFLVPLVAAPAFANAFTVDFENQWDYGVDVDAYYAGGSASDGSTGSDLGVSFVGVSGLSNDAYFTQYGGAPSPLGVAYAHTYAAGDAAYMNVASGVSGVLSFYYSSLEDAIGAVKAYSGLNGTGTLLGTIDLSANSTSYDHWSVVSFGFSGVAQSFDLTGSANSVAFDNIAAVPEPGSLAMAMAGGAVLLAAARRRRR